MNSVICCVNIPTIVSGDPTENRVLHLLTTCKSETESS